MLDEVPSTRDRLHGSIAVGFAGRGRGQISELGRGAAPR